MRRRHIGSLVGEEHLPLVALPFLLLAPRILGRNERVLWICLHLHFGTHRTPAPQSIITSTTTHHSLDLFPVPHRSLFSLTHSLVSYHPSQQLLSQYGKSSLSKSIAASPMLTLTTGKSLRYQYVLPTDQHHCRARF